MAASELERYFSRFRKQIVGIDHRYSFSGGMRELIYADWTASGRLYGPIEEFISRSIGPLVANTHTETTLSGTTMTRLYQQARQVIKAHVNAGPGDVLLNTGSGMTGAVSKFQRILNLKIPEPYRPMVERSGLEKPLVLITHMEHHSNQTSWEECFCDVRIVRRGSDGLPDLGHLRELLEANRGRQLKIGSFSACSNVTGIQTPLHEMAALMHEYGGLCFGDYAASAPYVKMDMHPADPRRRLDAIFFSPHKFLGGPGSSGVLVFDRALYHNQIPDQPGGGTVAWTNPWGGHRFVADIEAREDGGTPGFLQTIRAALAILLKEEMGVDRILAREHELKDLALAEFRKIPRIAILEPQLERLGIVSFYSPDAHFNLIVRLLNDRFGIQTRGGCSCAGTYGHILLDVDPEKSQAIACKIDQGDLSEKPGWVRVSLHPTMTDAEVRAIADAVGEVLRNFAEWSADYRLNAATGEFEQSGAIPRSPLSLTDIAFH
ncbi:MAG: aminotransferase class V-fold PLP-dependent enzyme [Oligoflexia bacterium]|nr:aminotransferase class V-fold PLP-dependent enzyme [Oligoflexia bacterium]